MPPTPTPSAPDVLTELHADAQALLAKIQAAGAKVEPGLANLLKSIEAPLAAGVRRIGAVIAGEAQSELPRLEQAVTTELVAQVPIIAQAVVAAVAAAIEAAAPLAANPRSASS